MLTLILCPILHIKYTDFINQTEESKHNITWGYIFEYSFVVNV